MNDIHKTAASQCRCWATAEVVTAFQRVTAVSVCVSVCVCVCVCVCVLLQSKWPFGKATRVIIVNYSVKLRGLLRGKQIEWAILSFTSCESSLITLQTSLSGPGCRQRMQAYPGSGSNRGRNKQQPCAYTCPSHPLPCPFTSPAPLFFSVRAVDDSKWGMEWFNWQTGSDDGKVGGRGAKVKMKTKGEGRGWITKRYSALLLAASHNPPPPPPHTHTNTQFVIPEQQVENLLQIDHYFLVAYI